MPEKFQFTPIGVVRSPFTQTAAIPKGLHAKHDAQGTIELRPELEAGLADIEGFSHLYVIWVFDRADGSELTAYPPSDNRPRRSVCHAIAPATQSDRPHRR